MKFSVSKILWSYFLNYFINNGTPRQERFLFRLLSLKCTLLYSSKDREMNVTDTHFRCCISQYPKTCFYLGTSESWWHDYLRLESSTVSHSSSFTRGLRVHFTPWMSNKKMNMCSFSLQSLHTLQHCSKVICVSPSTILVPKLLKQAPVPSHFHM